MCQPSPRAESSTPELADVLRIYGPAFAATHPLVPVQQRALRAIVNCRTEALGAQMMRCDRCGHQVVRYHSCRNRHCPKCQAGTKERWVQARQAELLPVEYFHVVFTLPHELNPLARGAPCLIYRLLFQCATQTLLAFARDPKWLGATPGITAILHTWDQRLNQHLHLHCLVSGGGLDEDGHWVASKPHFLFPVRALSKVFRGKLCEALAQAFEKGEVHLPQGDDASVHIDYLATLRAKPWVVYAKPPFAGPQQVLAYLGRYTHRTAIGNHRIVAIDQDEIRFRWRDRAHGDKQRHLSLPAETFIERFMRHILPKGFQRIRHYGLLGNRCKRERLALARQALAVPAPEPSEPETVEVFMLRVSGIDIDRCPNCGMGQLRAFGELGRSMPVRATGPPP